MDFWIGATMGLFAGTAMGVFLTCVMVAARREPEEDTTLAVSWVPVDGQDLGPAPLAGGIRGAERRRS